MAEQLPLCIRCQAPLPNDTYLERCEDCWVLGVLNLDHPDPFVEEGRPTTFSIDGLHLQSWGVDRHRPNTMPEEEDWT